jgi:hypothetical protein
MGGGGAGGGAGTTPTQLAFTTPARTQSTSVCSAALTLEARNAANMPVTPSTPLMVALTATAGSAVTFFTSSSCTAGSVATSVNLTMGSPTATVYVRGTVAGTFTLTASSPPLTAASQSTTFIQGPDSLDFITTLPVGLRGGQCVGLTYQARRAFMPFMVTQNITIAFSATSTVRFYSDFGCTMPITTKTLAAGESTDDVFIRVLSTSGIITATAPFGSDTESFTAPPIVRRGTCPFFAQVPIDGGTDPDGGTIDAGFSQSLSRSCGFAPAVATTANAMLLVQVTTTQDADHRDVMTRCRLQSTSLVGCTRRQGVAAVDVQWQVVELGAGLRVQAQSFSTCPSAIVPFQSVDPARSFVLKTLMAGSDGELDEAETLPYTLASGSLVTSPGTMCGGLDVQIVEWDGVSVARGILDGGFAPGVTSATLLGLPPAGNNRVLSLQAGTSTNANSVTCGLLARGAMPGPSELTISRALRDAGCPATPLERVTFERIDFGTRATVQTFQVTMGPNETQRTEVIPSPVDTSRTFVLSSNQSILGQGLGETLSPLASRPAEGAFSFELPTPTSLRVTRGRASSAARVTVFVVQVE